MTTHRTIDIDGIELFVREAGSAEAPAIVLLHGLPASSHQFRHLIPLLAERYRVIAPDYPGFGYSATPRVDAFAYTFERISQLVERLLERLGVERYALYVFDFGAPVGLRLAARRPERITALIVQNGNAYEEGLGAQMHPLRALWQDRAAVEPRLRAALDADFVRRQYLGSAAHPERIAPDSWTLDAHLLDLPGRRDAVLELLYDYRDNVERYPEWQAYLREHRPPTLIVWGARDDVFTVDGAHGLARDVPAAELHLLDAGHFALEEELDAIAERITAFLPRALEVGVLR